MERQSVSLARRILQGDAHFDSFEEIAPLAQSLRAVDRGALLALAWRHQDDGRSYTAVFASQIEHQTPLVILTERAVLDCVDALLWLDQHWTPDAPREPRLSAEQLKQARQANRAWMVFSQMAMRPTVQVQSGLKKILPLLSEASPIQRYAAAYLVGDTATAMIAKAAFYTEAHGDLERQEWDLLLQAEPMSLIGMLPHRYLPLGGASEPENVDAVLTCLQSIPDYPAFAERLFALAETRLDDIYQGRVPYKAHGAFPTNDCHVIARAAMFGLSRAAPWCRDRIGTVWHMASHAPDPKAKTMPSESLSIGLANAAVAEPRLEAITALRAVAASCRHAGVKKKLDRLSRTARTALMGRPERLLDQTIDDPGDKATETALRDAVQALLADPQTATFAVWVARFGPERKFLWALAQDLIWEIGSNDHDRFTAMPERRDEALVWRLIDGLVRDAHANDAIRLWHPVDTADSVSREWRLRLQQTARQQPFVQAGREIYRPAPNEMAGRRIARFAGTEVDGMALMGLARTSGWRFGTQDELHLTLKGIGFTFATGVRAFPGAGDLGVTGDLHLDGPQDRLDQVPPRILSELMRKADLLVSVGSRR